MQLRKPQLVGAVHDDGVGRRHVDARFNNGATNQNVEALVIEIEHHRFQFALTHLAMGRANVGLGQQFSQLTGGPLHGADFVVQVVDLTAAADLAQAGLPNQGFIPVCDKGLDRISRSRRRGNNR